MQKNTKKLDQKINQITITYKELRKEQFYIVKKNIIGTLRQLCTEALAIIDRQNINTQNIRKKKQVEDMVKKCFDIEMKIDQQEKLKPEIGRGDRFSSIQIRSKNQGKQLLIKEQENKGNTQLMKKSRQVAKSIIFYQLQSKDMKISPQQLDKLATRFETNHAMMKQIEQMVIQQGEDVQKIEQNIKHTYELVKQANINLEEAAKIQKQTRLLKIRLGISGFLGAIGMKILGLPGLIFGFFGGLAATS